MDIEICVVALALGKSYEYWSTTGSPPCLNRVGAAPCMKRLAWQVRLYSALTARCTPFGPAT